MRQYLNRDDVRPTEMHSEVPWDQVRDWSHGLLCLELVVVLQLFFVTGFLLGKPSQHNCGDRWAISTNIFLIGQSKGPSRTMFVYDALVGLF